VKLLKLSFDKFTTLNLKDWIKINAENATQVLRQSVDDVLRGALSSPGDNFCQ
jgi:hypothetical protein